jgi:ribosomal protein S18 acetylase RimI-like enzyme
LEPLPSSGSAGRTSGLIFAENGTIDPLSLNDVYRLVGWDRGGRRTAEETAEMLRVSRYYIAAYVGDRLVGFARVCGDPYVAQVLDVITHPEYRRLGIATRCVEGVVPHLRQSRYVSVTLTDDTGLPDFYERFGFRRLAPDTVTRRWRPTIPSGTER